MNYYGEKYGFIYVWRDKGRNRFYVGSHWGYENDGYICSSAFMRNAYNRRPNDFRRRVVSRIMSNRADLLKEEQRWLDMIKDEELHGVRYYNHRKDCAHWGTEEERVRIISEKLSAANKGKHRKGQKRDPEIGKKISETKVARFAALREQSQDGFIMTPEQRAEMSEKQKARGHKHSDEHKRRMHEIMRAKWESGELTYVERECTAETREKLSKSLTGKKKPASQARKLSEINSKEYVVSFSNGSDTIIKGLKRYGIETGIPYVTLFKAAQQGTPILKYGISSIRLSERINL